MTPGRSFDLECFVNESESVCLLDETAGESVRWEQQEVERVESLEYDRKEDADEEDEGEDGEEEASSTSCCCDLRAKKKEMQKGEKERNRAVN